MSRAAVLIAAAALALVSCVRVAPRSATAGRCVGCHPVHRAEAGPCVSCHRGDPEAAREHLAHARLITGRAAEHRSSRSDAVLQGSRLVETLACRRCHSVGGEGNRFATSLDHSVWQREQAALVASIRTPVETMPRFGVSEMQAELIVAYLLNRANRTDGQPTYRVRFTSTGATKTLFGERCGGCHRAILREGPAGEGMAGPNLSGMLTVHYPANASGSARWTEQTLKDWLRNPRAKRATTTMPPQRLTDTEWPRLLDELRSE